MQEICQTIQEFLTAHGIPDWLVVFLISLCPILECRLGMFTAIVLLQMNPFVGFLISFLGNIIPIPFILLLINWIFEILKKVPGLNKIVYWLEEKLLKNVIKLINTVCGACFYSLQFLCPEQADGRVHCLHHFFILIKRNPLVL